MIKIGEFSKLVQIPVATLRYYDQVGLLKPVAVDRATGYRYYSASQLPRLHRILALKGLGFSLEQMLAAIRLIRRRFRVRAAAITAYDPAADSSGRACRAGLQLLQALVEEEAA